MAVHEAPMVVNWYRGFCRMAVLLYSLLAVIGVVVGHYQESLISKGYPESALTIFRLIYLQVSLPLAVLSGMALLLPRSGWAWVIHGVNIILNFLNPCFLPLMIFMLLSWMKPQTRAYFIHNP